MYVIASHCDFDMYVKGPSLLHSTYQFELLRDIVVHKELLLFTETVSVPKGEIQNIHTSDKASIISVVNVAHTPFGLFASPLVRNMQLFLVSYMSNEK